MVPVEKKTNRSKFKIFEDQKSSGLGGEVRVSALTRLPCSESGPSRTGSSVRPSEARHPPPRSRPCSACARKICQLRKIQTDFSSIFQKIWETSTNPPKCEHGLLALGIPEDLCQRLADRADRDRIPCHAQNSVKCGTLIEQKIFQKIYEDSHYRIGVPGLLERTPKLLGGIGAQLADAGVAKLKIGRWF